MHIAVLGVVLSISYIIALNPRFQCVIHNSQCIRMLYTYAAIRYLRVLRLISLLALKHSVDTIHNCVGTLLLMIFCFAASTAARSISFTTTSLTPKKVQYASRVKIQ